MSKTAARLKITLRTLLVLALLALTVLCGGCVKARLKADVDTSGRAALDYTIGVDRSAQVLSAVGADPLAGVRNRLSGEGFAIAGWSEGQYEGFRATKRVDRLESIPGVSVEGDEGLSFARGIPFDTYDLNGKVELDAAVPGGIDGLVSASGLGAGANAALSDNLVSQADIEFTMVLPVAAGVTNATRVSTDRRTLTWKLIPGQMTDLRAEARSVGLVGVLGLAFGVTLLVGVTFLIVRARKRAGVGGSDGPAQGPGVFAG